MEKIEKTARSFVLRGNRTEVSLQVALIKELGLKSIFYHEQVTITSNGTFGFFLWHLLQVRMSEQEKKQVPSMMGLKHYRLECLGWQFLSEAQFDKLVP